MKEIHILEKLKELQKSTMTFNRARKGKIIMNPLVYISIRLHFEVKDAKMYGGVGSIGYAAINLDGIMDINQITDEYVEAQTQTAAGLFRVPRTAVRLISKEEYDLETDNEDEYFDFTFSVKQN